MCQKIFLTRVRFMWLIDYYIVGVFAMMTIALMLIWKEIRKIERKIENHEEKPSYKKYWGHGKKKR